MISYAEYVRNHLKQQEQGTPIYTDEIVDAIAADYEIDKKNAAAATAVAIKRIMDKGEPEGGKNLKLHQDKNAFRVLLEQIHEPVRGDLHFHL